MLYTRTRIHGMYTYICIETIDRYKVLMASVYDCIVFACERVTMEENGVRACTLFSMCVKTSMMLL